MIIAIVPARSNFPSNQGLDLGPHSKRLSPNHWTCHWKSLAHLLQLLSLCETEGRTWFSGTAEPSNHHLQNRGITGRAKWLTAHVFVFGSGDPKAHIQNKPRSQILQDLNELKGSAITDLVLGHPWIFSRIRTWYPSSRSTMICFYRPKKSLLRKLCENRDAFYTVTLIFILNY